DGIRRNLDPGEPVDVDPGLLSEAERQQRGIVPLPAGLEIALDSLAHDEVLRNALGPELVRAFLAVRRAEWEALRGKELADEVKLLLERY
ncbi:MAG TPA: hypothetical protein VNK04_08745, partial [Gemmataceae bacterium]|nr:hypothetical protein [Gemmataceae bacterium]